MICGVGRHVCSVRTLPFLTTSGIHLYYVPMRGATDVPSKNDGGGRELHSEKGTSSASTYINQSRMRNPLFARLWRERQRRELLKADPSMERTLSQLTPDEQAEHMAVLTSDVSGTHPDAQEYYQRARQRFTERMEAKHANERDEEEWHTLNLRRQRAQQHSIERGFAERMTRKLKRSISHQQQYVSSQSGRYCLVDPVRRSLGKTETRTTQTRDARSSGLFLG